MYDKYILLQIFIFWLHGECCRRKMQVLMGNLKCLSKMRFWSPKYENTGQKRQKINRLSNLRSLSDSNQQPLPFCSHGHWSLTSALSTTLRRPQYGKVLIITRWTRFRETWQRETIPTFSGKLCKLSIIVFLLGYSLLSWII